MKCIAYDKRFEISRYNTNTKFIAVYMNIYKRLIQYIKTSGISRLTGVERRRDSMRTQYEGHLTGSGDRGLVMI